MVGKIFEKQQLGISLSSKILVKSFTAIFQELLQILSYETYPVSHFNYLLQRAANLIYLFILYLQMLTIII